MKREIKVKVQGHNGGKNDVFTLRAGMAIYLELPDGQCYKIRSTERNGLLISVDGQISIYPRATNMIRILEGNFE